MEVLAIIVMCLSVILALGHFSLGNFALGALWIIIAFMWNNTRKTAIESKELEMQIKALREKHGK